MNLKNMRECDKSKNTCKQQLPIVYMSFNNVGHLITSTIIYIYIYIERNLYFTLVISQESLHDARSTKCTQNNK